jgi:hypothetical protein
LSQRRWPWPLWVLLLLGLPRVLREIVVPFPLRRFGGPVLHKPCLISLSKSPSLGPDLATEARDRCISAIRWSSFPYSELRTRYRYRRIGHGAFSLPDSAVLVCKPSFLRKYMQYRTVSSVVRAGVSSVVSRMCVVIEPCPAPIRWAP